MENISYDNLVFEDVERMHKLKANKKIKVKSKLKCSDEDFQIPSFNDFEKINNISYNVKQLKAILANYKLKKTGNKNELVKRIYDFLYKSFYICKIQKNMRRKIVYLLFKKLGPASKNIELCTNNTDFYSLEKLNNFKFNEIISIKDENDNHIYGFTIQTMNIYIKNNANTDLKNPYNRTKINENIQNNISSIKRICKILNLKLNIESHIETIKKDINQRIFDIFHKIDELGNYSNHIWFLNLDHGKLIKFIFELKDIWVYRANLSDITKINICHPTGNPFLGINMNFIRSTRYTNNLKIICVDIMSNMINKGINNEYRSLGALYILTALTLVSSDAASALPWLYDSVM